MRRTTLRLLSFAFLLAPVVACGGAVDPSVQTDPGPTSDPAHAPSTKTDSPTSDPTKDPSTKTGPVATSDPTPSPPSKCGAPVECAAGFDPSASCDDGDPSCMASVCTQCSEDGYIPVVESFSCKHGRWVANIEGVADCGDGSGGNLPGTYADPKCETKFLADGGVGPGVDGGS